MITSWVAFLVGIRTLGLTKWEGQDAARQKTSDNWNEADADERAAIEEAMNSNDSGYANGVAAEYIGRLRKNEASRRQAGIPG